MTGAKIVVTIPAAGAPADFVGTTIVLVGPFDPLLLQPASLAEKGLLAKDDLAQLRYEILAPEVSIMRLPWIVATVEPMKLTGATTLESPIADPVRDFIFGLYATVPRGHLTAVGLNHDTHFAVRTEEAWHKLGNFLAPKDQLWRRVLKNPGTTSLRIRGERDDGMRGQVNVKIEPSLRIHPGIYININDHFSAGDGPDADPERLFDLASEQWTNSMRRCDDIVAAVKGLM